MRMLIDLDFPPEPFNSYIRDGSIGTRLGKVLGEIKPEAAYFATRNGRRGGTLVVNVSSPADPPRIAEPFFIMFNAAVEFDVCLTPEDLGAAGLEEMGKKWG
jgi:hypothetical protein